MKNRKNIEIEVKELTSEVGFLMKVASSISLLGIAAGAIGAITAGPIAFMIGAGLGAVTSGGLSVYSKSKKKEIEKEVNNLKQKHQITESQAINLMNKLHAIYSTPV